MKRTQWPDPLAQGNWRQSKQPAEPLQETFIQNVSHELRTPLALVLGYAELLGNEALGSLAPEQREAMLVILNQAHDLHSLVERVNILLSSGAHVRNYQPVNMTEVILSAAAAQKPQAERVNIAFQYALTNHTPDVWGYRDDLQHMVECLLDNAIKFSPGSQTVRVELCSHPRWVHISIVDTGIGMTHEQSEAIVNHRFYQVDSSATRPFGGLGLGLTVVKAVLLAHSGHLEIISELGQGSRFTVKLPAHQPGLTYKLDKAIQKGAAATTQRILVVDDEQHVAHVLKQSLKRLPNSHITIAYSGEEALRLLVKEPFDLLITDYNMPGLDGVALARQVRQQYPHTVVVLLTAYRSPQIDEAAAAVNIHQVLNKPVRMDEIRHLAQGLLQSGNTCPELNDE